MVLLNEKRSGAKIKVLALHGSGSNGKVTRMQLDNLGLPESEFDVVYLNGPVAVSEPGHGIAQLQGLVSGPWYSWLPKSIAYGDVSQQKLQDYLSEALETVLKTIESEGPFDGIFGFSQGAVIAHLVANLHNDETLLAQLQKRTNQSIRDILNKNAPLRGAVYACAAAPLDFQQLRERAGLGDPVSEQSKISSVHLIGRQDDFKSWSEAFALAHNDALTEVRYLPEGHEISRDQRNNSEVVQLVRQALNGSLKAAEGIESTPLQWLNTSSLSTRAVASDVQMTKVKFAFEQLPQTIPAMLARQNPAAPLLRNARDDKADNFTSYGQMLEFCQAGGEGDLRRLGVGKGEVVAYLAPVGGNAVAATAFLSVAAQTCAVPFSTGMSEADALLALEQYGVKHMILFNGVSAPGVKAAFEVYADNGHGDLHFAEQSESASPGLFRYLDPVAGFETLPELVNGPQDNGLLLRTSGTTSVPKVVPLKHKDLVLNGAILADGIGLRDDDVTYSIMPLDHIGGLSGSILCSVAAGAAITCDGLYNPQSMVEALTDSVPRPTWYSAVPTIHNGTVRYLHDRADAYLGDDKQWHGHNLRMVRSGAAALKEADRTKVESTYGVDVVSTYSMSEMMPIAQPPKTENGWQQTPGAVGVPVAASMAVVDPQTMQPLPFGSRGEVAISGPTVFSGYMNNDEANAKSRFLMRSADGEPLQSWFLTGDLGQLSEEGTLSLKGRLKELIKRGGEQVAPAEVEAVLTQHPGVTTAVCFSVPSDNYGEEVGCALVLEPEFAANHNQREITKALRVLAKQAGLASFKFPSVWKIVEIEALPRTANRKFIRNGLADVLGVKSGHAVETTEQNTKTNSKPAQSRAKKLDKPVVASGDFHSIPSASGAGVSDKPKVDWAALAGLRFVLACYVMFMHIGSNESWGAFNNLRQFPWHVHTFFTLAGFSLAIIMPAMINKKLSFVSARVAGMYPLYGLAIVLAASNLLVGCNPTTFIGEFNWSPLLSGGEELYCQGTPWVEDSWLANFLLTIGIHATGLQATPLWGATWFLGFYLWFISMYFQCLIVFPFIYNALYKNRGNTKKLLTYTVIGLVANMAIVLGFWYGFAVDATGYGLFDAMTGLRTVPSAEQVALAGEDNATILGFYLFSPFWMVYFIAGMCAAFVFDSIRPNEQQRAKIWGHIADGITLILIAFSIAHIAQGYAHYGPEVQQVALDPFFMRPDEANSYADPSTVNRIWDNIWGRLFAPLTLLWIFAISTGQGLTAKMLRFSPLSQTLAPTAYACFLFHQLVGQWYYAVTRNGEWWNWWTDQKTFYWFSPQPVAVEWYEYFYVVGLVVLFSKAVQPLEPVIRRGFVLTIEFVKGLFGGKEQSFESRDTTGVVLGVVERVTGMEASEDLTLEECGLASLGLVQFANTLESEFSTPEYKISLSVPDLMEAEDIRAIVALVDAAVNDSQNSTSSGNVGSPQMA